MPEKKQPVKWEYDIEGNHGYGWDVETCEPSLKEARAMVKTYQKECPTGRYRIKRVKAEN